MEAAVKTQAVRKPPVKIPNNPWLRWGIYPLGLAPALWAFWLAANNQLGANPVKEFEHILGLWALRFLILTLLVTPLRDIFRLNFILYRRALGLIAFYYVVTASGISAKNATKPITINHLCVTSFRISGQLKPRSRMI